MNVDELRTIQNRERQTDSLQPLPGSFYEEVAAHVQELRAERERVADKRGFDAPEFRRLSDEIDAVEDTVESIYERRVGKIVKAASFAAAGMPTDDEGLTDEERALFESLVAEIETNREHVLDVLAGEVETDAPATPGLGPASDRLHEGSSEVTAGEPPGEADATQDPAPEPGMELDADEAIGPAVDAADAMGGASAGGRTRDGTATDPASADGTVPDGMATDGTATGEAAPDETAPDGPTADEAAPDGTAIDGCAGGAAPESPAATGRTTPGTEGAGPAAGPASDSGTADAGATVGDGDRRGADDGSPATESGGDRDSASTGSADSADVDRATIRITRDVGEILGVDERAYDLERDDVVTLPAANAEPLVERDAAERLD